MDLQQVGEPARLAARLGEEDSFGAEKMADLRYERTLRTSVRVAEQVELQELPSAGG